MENPGNELPLIGQIAKLKLEQGDMLVIRVDRSISCAERDRINGEVWRWLQQKNLHGRVPLLVLDGGKELQVLDAQSLAQPGAGESGEGAKQA